MVGGLHSQVNRAKAYGTDELWARKKDEKVLLVVRSVVIEAVGGGGGGVANQSVMSTLAY